MVVNWLVERNMQYRSMSWNISNIFLDPSWAPYGSNVLRKACSV